MNHKKLFFYFTKNYLRIDIARECNFTVSGGKRFEFFSTSHLHGFDVCTSLPKNLWVCHYNDIVMILFDCVVDVS